MCGRLAITTDARVTVAQMRCEGEPARMHPRHNVKPTETVPVVALGALGRRKWIEPRWGLVPHWSKALAAGAPMINARDDSLAKATWRDSFHAVRGRGGRCLIPWDAFYEWSGPKNNRQPNTITTTGNRARAMAGLWAAWRDPAKARDADPLLSCAIVTVPANAAVARIHDRMPAILDEDAWPLWLGETASSEAELIGLLQPYPADLTRIEAGAPF